MHLPFLALVAGLLMGLNASAAVVDELDCQLTLSGGSRYPSIEARFPLLGVRKEFAIPGHPELKGTQATLSTQIASKSFMFGGRAGLTLEIRSVHAVQAATPDSPAKGAHYRCVNVSLEVDGDQIPFECPDMPPHPFEDPSGGWSKVSVEDGIPRFAPKFLSFQISSSPAGNGMINCQRVATHP